MLLISVRYAFGSDVIFRHACVDVSSVSLDDYYLGVYFVVILAQVNDAVDSALRLHKDVVEGKKSVPLLPASR